MKYLEIIELRLINHHKKILEEELHILINELNEKHKNIKIKLYYNISIDTDFSIHVLHDSGTFDPDKNGLSSLIESSLKEFGIINGSTWVEKIKS